MRHARGFTLLEVLLSITIVVVLTATMAVTLQVSFGLKKSAEQAVQSVQNSRSVTELWMKDVSGIVPPSPNSNQDVQAAAATASTTSGSTASSGTVQGGVNTNTTGLPLYLFGPFFGYSDRMYFYTLGSESQSTLSPGVEYVQYGLLQQPDGTSALVRQAETNLLGDQDPTTFPSGLAPEVIVPRVLQVEFEYWDGTNLQWAQTWDSTAVDGLPYAVQMKLTVAGNNPGDQPYVITRFATVTCAAPSTLTNGNGSSTGALGGFGGN